MKIVEINGVAPGDDDQIMEDGDQDSDQNNTQMSFGEMNEDEFFEGQVQQNNQQNGDNQNEDVDDDENAQQPFSASPHR